MNSIRPAEDPRKQSREFGLLMTLVLCIVSGVLIWKRNPSVLYPLSVALVLLGFSVFAPLALHPFERAWMKFAEKLSVVMTFIMVTFIFVFAIIPMGLLLKVLRKDLLSLTLEPDRESYWEPVEVDGPSVRYYSPY